MYRSHPGQFRTSLGGAKVGLRIKAICQRDHRNRNSIAGHLAHYYVHFHEKYATIIPNYGRFPSKCPRSYTPNLNDPLMTAN